MLTERNRAVLYRRLSDVVGDEEAVGEMLSNFPVAEGERLVTESMLDAKLDAKVNALALRLIMWMVGLAVAGCGVIVAAMGVLAG